MRSYPLPTTHADDPGWCESFAGVFHFFHSHLSYARCFVCVSYYHRFCMVWRWLFSPLASDWCGFFFLLSNASPLIMMMRLMHYRIAHFLTPSIGQKANTTRWGSRHFPLPLHLLISAVGFWKMRLTFLAASEFGGVGFSEFIFFPMCVVDVSVTVNIWCPVNRKTHPLTGAVLRSVSPGASETANRRACDRGANHPALTTMTTRIQAAPSPLQCLATFRYLVLVERLLSLLCSEALCDRSQHTLADANGAPRSYQALSRNGCASDWSVRSSRSSQRCDRIYLAGEIGRSKTSTLHIRTCDLHSQTQQIRGTVVVSGRVGDHVRDFTKRCFCCFCFPLCRARALSLFLSLCLSLACYLQLLAVFYSATLSRDGRKPQHPKGVVIFSWIFQTGLKRKWKVQIVRGAC